MLGSRKRLDLRNKSPKERDKKFSSRKYRSFSLDQNLWKNLQYLWRHMTEQKITEKNIYFVIGNTAERIRLSVATCVVKTEGWTAVPCKNFQVTSCITYQIL